MQLSKFTDYVISIKGRLGRLKLRVLLEEINLENGLKITTGCKLKDLVLERQP